MSELVDRVKHLFEVSIENKISLADLISDHIIKAANRLVSCLLSDAKILICGNGGSAANALHFSTSMLNHFEVERPPLPVISLMTDITLITSIVSEGHADQRFARQIQAIGQENDILMVLSTTGNSNSLLQAVKSAHDRGMDVIVLSGRDGGLLANHLGPEDIELRVNGESSARIREVHLFILHVLCDLIDHSLFGQMTG